MGKLCSKCDNPNDRPAKSRCQACADLGTEFSRARRQRLQQAGLCIDCKKPAAHGRLRCQLCLDSLNEKQKVFQRRAKVAVLEAYGGAFCACCGEAEILMLTLDHVNQNGSVTRLEEGSGSRIYHHLKKQGFPPGFRVLCRNCNYAVYFSEDHVCPHRTGIFLGSV